MSNAIPIPPERIEPLTRALHLLQSAQRIVLTTHVHADGDGAGCEAAVAAWLAGHGKSVAIVNPTPYPALFRYLLQDPGCVADPGETGAAAALRAADLLVVLDTGEPKRIGRVARARRGRPVVVIDHHPPGAGGFEGALVQDPGACATGELIYDLLLLAGEPEPWPRSVVDGLYAAIVTDTGSFRFANTTPRAHAIAGELMRRGVDPEEAYRRLFGTVPMRRIQLLRRALDNLELDPDVPVAWITIPRDAAEELGITSEDLDGIIEYARSIEGTEVALLFRETSDGATKISFRSNGDVDVNVLARHFGGGGHVKAAGALVGAPVANVRAEVLEATRAAVRAARAEVPADTTVQRRRG